MENVNLCFINFIGTDIDGNNTYEFLFTHDIDTFWGENFEIVPSGLCNQLTPNEDSFNIVKYIKTDLKLCLAQNSCCHSFQDTIDGILALAYEDISTYDYYPDDGRLVFHFGEQFNDVELKLAKKHIVFKEKDLE